MKTIRVLPAALLALACGVAGSAAAADHLYQLNGNLNDSLGGPALTASGGTIGASAYSFGANQGLTMGVSLGSVYTIDMSFHFNALDTTSNGYQKVIDFSGLTNDAGMYVLHNNWNFYPVVNYSSPLVVAGQDARLTVTRDASQTVTVYVNGAALGSFNDSSGRADFGANNAVFFIDDIATGQREASAGAVDYIRTFDKALTDGQVSALPPPVPEPANIAMLIAGLGMLAFIARRQQKG